MEVTILGSGTSQGVPVIACDCTVCLSKDSKDKRLRASILFNIDGKNFVVDAGPDFRTQLLRENVQQLSGILFTHEHKDHIAGLDDVRAFNYKQNRPMDVYCNAAVEQALKREFYYIFENANYPGVPKITLNNITKNRFELNNGVEVQPIEVMHYKMPVLGFRLGDFTYITDAKTISEEEVLKVLGTKILIVNALHLSPHISHFNLEEALEFIARINPEKAYITHISHLFGTHQQIEKLLPPNIFAAYDGMKIKID
jgi:phosphoribosyl 1,2-cyclic phosphate phosphodiesterase